MQELIKNEKSSSQKESSKHDSMLEQLKFEVGQEMGIKNTTKIKKS